ncbi:MAG: hypothetical protein ACR2IR_11570 [Acidimicrobiia bacterium]
MAVAPRKRPPTNLGPLLVTLGGGGLIAGALMPWVSATAPFIGQVSYAGTKGDGQLTLVGGAIIAVLGLVLFSNPANRAAAVFALLVAIGAAVVCFYDISNVSEAVDEAKDLEVGVDAEVGSGLYVSVVSAVGAGVGAIIAVNTKTSTPRAGREEAPRPEAGGVDT